MPQRHSGLPAPQRDQYVQHVTSQLGSLPRQQPFHVSRASTPDSCDNGAEASAFSVSTTGSSPLEDTCINKGAISSLQEFVQGAKLYPLPPSSPVLQWSYDTRMTGTSLEFRATCAFLLDGVAHLTVGCWSSSKKMAQRIAAERTLRLFVSRWTSLITSDEIATEMEPLPEAGNNVELLERFCEKLPYGRQTIINWCHKWDDDLCQAFAEFQLLDVPHTFAGKRHQTRESAYEDTARRVLWYLQCPGYEDAFEPDQEYVKAVASDIPEPSSSWCKGDTDCKGDEKLQAERRTMVMRVQNRLQQAYARQLESGQSVWYWSFERDLTDSSWPPTFRATAHVPLAKQRFEGSWQKGQRDAQIHTCIQISEFLDGEFPKLRRACVTGASS